MNTAVLKTNKLINNYAPNPTLPFDVEGKVVEKNGKDIKIEKKIENKTFEYSLRLKDELQVKVGENVKIDKTDIVSYSVEEKKEETSNKEETINVEKALRELGLEYTSENVRMIESLLRNGIKISKGNVDSYVESKKYLRKIINNIDIEKSIKLREMGVNLEDDSLQKVAQALDSLEDEKFSFKKFLKIDRDISYKEAEVISKEIYGQRMGKDIYDSIIALQREKLPITKENIEKTIDTIKKINNLKNVEDKTYIKFIDDKIEFSIENLYKIKNQYTSNRIEPSTETSKFENMTIKSETSIDSLKQVLTNLGLEDNQENLMILREFIFSDIDITVEKYNNLIDMKDGVAELLNIIEEKGVSTIIKDENALSEDIYSLIEKLKNEASNINDKNKDMQISNNQDEDNESIKALKSIEDKELLDLIKKGEDFNIKNILDIKKININTENEQIGNSIEYETVQKTDKIINIFTNLGDKLNPSIIARTSHEIREISLESLDIASRQENNIVDARILQREEIEFIQSEYTRIKSTLTTNVIKTSIIEGKLIEKVPLEQLNQYIRKSLNKYKEISKVTQDIININGKEERLIPMIMKNNLEMTLKELKSIDSFLNGEKGITNIIKEEILSKDKDYSEEFKEGIKTLQKSISEGIKKGETIKEDYNKLMNSMSGEDKPDKDNAREERKQDYLKIRDKISNKDMIFQFPLEIGSEYKTLNIIVPNAKAGIDKDDMNFFISLETDNIGKVNLDISVKKKNIYINLDEEMNILRPMINELRDQIKSIGYTLIEENQVVI